MAAEIVGGDDAIAQVVLVERFLQTDGDGFEIASGESAVGRIALGEDEQVLLLRGEQVVVGAEEAADVGHAIFLGGHGAAVAEREHLLRDLLGSLVGVSRFAQLDEVGVLREAAGVEVERNADACGKPGRRLSRSPSRRAVRRRSCW